MREETFEKSKILLKVNVQQKSPEANPIKLFHFVIDFHSGPLHAIVQTLDTGSSGTDS
jgi:hypothetical protein